MSNHERSGTTQEKAAYGYILLQNILAKHPELRISQVLSISAKKAGWENDDLFYCPDDTLIDGLVLFLKEVRQE